VSKHIFDVKVETNLYPSDREASVYQTIVVGTDGSDTATKSVSKAATIAQRMGARLYVVTAYGTKAVDSSAEPPTDLEWLASAGVRADVLLQQAIAPYEGTDIDVETRACVGEPASALIDVAAEVNADLIVVGNKGMTGLARFLLGSVPNKVAHHAPCDVLIVRTT
jgi:nucleotide-binding universal stress UspA family protein